MALPSENEAEKNPRRKRWLTHLSIAAVIVVLWGFAAIIMPPLPGAPHVAKRTAAKAQIDAFFAALEMFKADNGFYPAGTNGLNDLVVNPSKASTNWHQYLDSIPLDPWGRPYHYVSPGRHNTSSYDLSSAGPDGILGTSDDIAIWK